MPTIQNEESSTSEDEEKVQQETFNLFEFQSDDDGLQHPLIVEDPQISMYKG